VEVKDEEEFWGRGNCSGSFNVSCFLLVSGIKQANGKKQKEVI
tara:strand:+ start:1455 stop:1583 length:129 start_codon:yes stop_codon:yes gene_type:complete